MAREQELPHDKSAEQSVLGAIFIDPNQFWTVAEHVTGESFFFSAHRVIFEVMQDLSDRREAIDGVTVASALSQRGDLGKSAIPYLAQLITVTPTSKNAAYYAKIVAEKALARQVIQDLSGSIGAIYEGQLPVTDVIDKVEQSLLVASGQKVGAGFRPIHDVLSVSQEILDKRAKQSSDVTGLATGFREFDKLTTGLHEDNLIIVAARPAMGKTAFALNIAQHVAISQGKPVAIFSLEMGAESLVERLLASFGNILSHHLRTGQLNDVEWKRLIYAQGTLAEAPLFIDDTAGIKISEIRSRARKLATEAGGLGLIVIDYLQLITGSRSDNRQQEVSEISRQLKVLSKELKVPVIALSQLSRSVEQRQDKRPIMSDLRESGSIEQDADIVAFLYRDDYYREKSGDNQPENNMTELLIKKNRHGGLGTVNLYFHKEYTKFSNVEG